MEKRLELMAADLGRDASAVERYNKLRDRFADLGGLTFRSRVRSALLGLGLTERAGARVSDLSGGQLRKGAAGSGSSFRRGFAAAG